MEVALLIGQLLLKYGPGVAAGVAQILAKKDPTLADWNEVFRLAGKSYDDYVRKPGGE